MRVTSAGLLVFTGSFGAYLLLAGEAGGTEIAAGLPAAALVTAFTLLSRRGDRRLLGLHGPWGRLAGAVGRSLLQDSARVGGALLRAILGRGAVGGTIDRQPFHPGGRESSDAGRRALVTLASSLAPNGFVLDVAPSLLPGTERQLLMHRLAPAPAAPDPEWPV